jgi:thioredoxin reductase
VKSRPHRQIAGTAGPGSFKGKVIEVKTTPQVAGGKYVICLIPKQSLQAASRRMPQAPSATVQTRSRFTHPRRKTLMPVCFSDSHVTSIERHVIGGQAGASSLIRNYLGFPRGISGAELTQRAYQQAWLFGAKFVFARAVTDPCPRGTKKILRLSDGREIASTAVLIATGAKYKSLDVPALERFIGVSVFYTTFGESRFVDDLNVAVIGGGNSAGQAAIHLARFARRVTLVVRANSLEKGMSDYLIQQIRSIQNIEVRLVAEVVGGQGGERLEFSGYPIQDELRG